MAAIPEWQRGIVAVGARLSGHRQAELIGTGWLIDLEKGYICTCAHVYLDCYPWNSSSKYLDPAQHGVAIGVGIGVSITWYCCAKLKYLSMPSIDTGYSHLHPPTSWPAPNDAKRLDLAVLEVVDWEGAPIPLTEVMMWHSSGAGPVRLPLGCSSTLADGDDLVLLGYGQGKDMGIGANRTSTTSRGFYCGRHFKATSGNWLKTGLTIYRYDDISNSDTTVA